MPSHLQNLLRSILTLIRDVFTEISEDRLVELGLCRNYVLTLRIWTVYAITRNVAVLGYTRCTKMATACPEGGLCLELGFCVS